MCGIAGYIGRRPLPTERLDATLTRMVHRGPDHQAHRSFQTSAGRHVHMLHSRLSIIDLDPRANQPFRVGEQWGVFNGELYNYLEVRQRLEEEGASFRTASDTEVLLAALARHGVDALDQCEGMWTLAVYDDSEGTLTLSRDRFGEKPLYLFRDGDDLYFASEVKAIASLLGRSLPINDRHLRRYLVNGYKALYKVDETFFEGVSELAPGSLLQIDAEGTERPGRYWHLGPPAQRPEMSYGEAVEGARQRLIRAMELRLRADVPLAFCMSGGVDSLSLISVARRVFDYDVHGFTIVSSDERYDEWGIVEDAISRLGIRHTAIPITTDDFLPRLRGLVSQHDSPVSTITYFAQWLLMEAISDHGYRISVSGSAADELFSGYYDHHLAYLYEVQGDPALSATARAAWDRHVAPIVRNPFLRDPDYFVRDPAARDHIYLDAELFSSFLTEPFLEPFAEERYTDDLLRNRMLNELFHEAVPVILHEDDLNAMSFSIENRSPFLDRDLYEFAGSVPTSHLVRDAYAKAVLRDAMRGIAPDMAMDSRRKVGFNAPILDFLDTSDPQVRAELLADSPVWEFVRREPISELVDAESLPNSKSKFLFYFLNAKMFLEEFST